MKILTDVVLVSWLAVTFATCLLIGAAFVYAVLTVLFTT